MLVYINMKKLFLAFLVISCFVASVYAERMVVSIPHTSVEQVQELFSNGYDIAHVVPGERVYVVVNEEERLRFSARYTHVEVVTTDAQMRENLRSTSRITGYHSYEQIVEILFELEALFPELCKVIELGPSQGRLYYLAGYESYADFNHTVYAVKLSNNVSVFQDKPNYFFTGVIHAREPLTAEVCLVILRDLLDTFDSEDESHPLNHTQIWIIPVINPDGHRVVHSGMNVSFRKTIYDNNNNRRFEANVDGIDGNRNFSYKWGTTGVSMSFSSHTYPGRYPFSAVEASYIRDLFKEVPFVAGINYHTYGEMVLYSLGYAWATRSHNEETFSALAHELASLIPRHRNPNLNYSAMPSWQLYPASGTSEDYAVFYHNILAFCIELAETFIPPAAAVQQIAQDNLPAAYHLLSRHKNSFLTGLITDKETGEPLRAEIKVFPIDAFHPERAPIFSCVRFGRYNYPLMPGHYQLLVMAENYYPFFSGFEIFQEGQTVINVELIPAEQFSVTLILSHVSEQELFHGAQITVKRSRTETLMADEAGRLAIESISPGEIVVIAKANNQKTYITDLFLSENDLRSMTHRELMLTFDDFTLVDSFDDLTENWSVNNWTVTSEQSFHGDNSATIMSFVSGASITSLEPVVIPQGDRAYINFMIKYTDTMQSNSFVEFRISEDRQTWNTLQQIREAPDWQNLYFIIPEDLYEQVYFDFTFFRFTGGAPRSNFYLDLFSVSVGQAIVTEKEPGNIIERDIVGISRDVLSISVYPNPFNPQTTFSLDISRDANVQIDVFNIRGQLVKSLINGLVTKGNHKIVWDGTGNNGKSISSGIYFYQAKTDNHVKHGKLMLLK